MKPKLLCLALAIGLIISCSNGGGGGGNPIATPTCVVLLGATAPTSSTVVAQRGAGTTCDVLAVDVIITDVNDVFTVGFDVDFDPALVSWSGISTAGSLLSSDGTPIATPIGGSGGKRTVGITRLGATGVNAVGPQLALTMFFRKVAQSGAAALSFSDTTVHNSQAGGPTLIPGITWYGATLSVQ